MSALPEDGRLQLGGGEAGIGFYASEPQTTWRMRPGGYGGRRIGR